MKNIDKIIPYEDLKALNFIYNKELSSVSDEVINSGWYILGRYLSEFESNFALKNNSNYCLGVASGLDALILGLSVFDFPKNSKVLVPSNTYIASILAIIKAGLVPVLVEPDEFTFNLTRDNLEEKYTKDCVAILAVHLYGKISPMDEIISFATENNLKVIEDCAQSHFASLNNRFAGTLGDIGAFSFYPTKILGCLGDGGAILCKDESIFIKLKALRNYGSQKKYHNKLIGYNSRLDEIQAAFLNCKLTFVDELIEHKRVLANLYFKLLNDVANIQMPLQSNEEENVWHIFNILTPERDNLAQYLSQFGIGTEVHYPIPPHKQEGYSHLFNNENYPISEKIHNQTLSLPISLIHTPDDIVFVCDKIKSFFTRN